MTGVQTCALPIYHGNTIIVIEHNLDIIKMADWIIDLGPEGGYKGGKIIATGTPEEVAEMPGSFTGKYIKRILNPMKNHHGQRKAS